MSRQVLSGPEIRAALLRGVNTLANTVTATLGPKGRCIILERNPMWPPVITTFTDPFCHGSVNWEINKSITPLHKEP